MEPAQHHFVTAQDFVAQCGGRIDGDPSTRVWRFSSLGKAHLGDASFLASPKYQDQLSATRASLVILKDAAAARSAGLTCTLIETPDPYLYFAKAATWLMERARQASVSETQIHESAVIDPTASIGKRVRIAAHVVIGPKAVVGDGCDLGAGSILEANVRLGSHCTVHPRVTLLHDCVVGDRAVLHSGVVIGSDGFGFAPQPDRSWLKIPQVGAVRIGHDVEIGANTTIDRGTLDDTTIGNGVKLDNLIQVAHNVVIGDHTVMAGCVGIAGSAVIGAHCQVGGAAGIAGHLQIADGTVIGPMSIVMSSITEPGRYVGVYPLQTWSDWEKSAANLRRLPELRRQVRELKNK